MVDGDYCMSVLELCMMDVVKLYVEEVVFYDMMIVEGMSFVDLDSDVV